MYDPKHPPTITPSVLDALREASRLQYLAARSGERELGLGFSLDGVDRPPILQAAIHTDAERAEFRAKACVFAQEVKTALDAFFTQEEAKKYGPRGYFCFEPNGTLDRGFISSDAPYMPSQDAVAFFVPAQLHRQLGTAFRAGIASAQKITEPPRDPAIEAYIRGWQEGHGRG